MVFHRNESQNENRGCRIKKILKNLRKRRRATGIRYSRFGNLIRRYHLPDATSLWPISRQGKMRGAKKFGSVLGVGGDFGRSDAHGITAADAGRAGGGPYSI